MTQASSEVGKKINALWRLETQKAKPSLQRALWKLLKADIVTGYTIAVLQGLISTVVYGTIPPAFT